MGLRSFFFYLSPKLSPSATKPFRHTKPAFAHRPTNDYIGLFDPLTQSHAIQVRLIFSFFFFFLGFTLSLICSSSTLTNIYPFATEGPFSVLEPTPKAVGLL